MQYDKEKIKDLLSKCSWRWAKSYVNVPHEYIVRNNCPLTDDEFLYIVRAQREIGVPERWGKYNFPYLYIDGYKYWTMGDTLPNTIIINRQKVFNEFNNLEIPNPQYYTDKSAAIICNVIKQIDCEKYYEIGCGDGLFLRDFLKALPENYKAVEPSNRLVYAFRQNNPKYYKCVSTKSFEESLDRWKNFDNCLLLGLFGSASYLMRPYLEMIPLVGKRYFLMFYREEFTPKGLEHMHHFNYSREYLGNIFKYAYKLQTKDYYIISSESIDLNKAKLEYEYNTQRSLFD